MTTPPTFPIPDTAVEAGALALCSSNRPHDGCVSRARAVLAAALATGEVRQEWRAVYGHPERADVWWIGNQTEAEARASVDEMTAEGNWPNPRAQSRSVVTFPDGSTWTSAWTEVCP